MEVNEVRANMMERLEEAQQMIQEKAQQITTITQESNSLRQQIAEFEAKLENCVQNKEMMEPDDISQLGPQSRFHNTLTIRSRTEMNLDENGALSSALGGMHPSLMPLKSGLPLTPESSNSTTTNALFFVRPGMSPNDTDSVRNLVGCDSRMSISADDFVDDRDEVQMKQMVESQVEFQVKQRESLIREQVRKQMKEQFETQKQQIRLDKDLEIQRTKQQYDARIHALEDEVGKYRDNELRMKERHRGEINGMRQRIDLLEFEASENESFVYAAINECDRAAMSRRNSRVSQAPPPMVEQSCSVNWGYLFGRSRRAKSPKPVSDL